MRPFAFADHAFFFGREDQSFELYRRLDRSRFIAVVGSSGSGKSSLVRAGLQPLIVAETAEAVGRFWRWVEMRPGDAPLASLATALAALAPVSDDPAAEAGRRERVAFILQQSRFGLAEAIDAIGGLADTTPLLFVDQFEELFRYAAGGVRESGGAKTAGSREEATQFVQLLLQAARDPARPVHVLLTMRSDFIGDCARFHDLPEAVSASQFLVPSLTRDQRQAVIRRPLEASGSTIEPTLVERLLNDAGDELDQLPVLQHCLQRLLEAAQSGAAGGPVRLLLTHYETIGGIALALSRHADEIMASLAGDELVVVQAFRALSEVDRDGRATRRALPFAQLLAETGVDEAALRRVLDRFRAVDCSFLVPALSAVPSLAPETRIDVGHEVLLRRWDKISAEPAAEVEGERRRGGWLRQEESDGHTYRALLALLQGGRTLPLDQVELRSAWWDERPRSAAWAERYGGHIDRVRELFDFSRTALAEARERETTGARRLAVARRRVFTATIAGLVIAVALTGIAGWQWQVAKRSLDQNTQTADALALLLNDTANPLAAAQKARAIFQGLCSTNPDNTDFQLDLSISDNKIGDALKAQGRLPEALAAYRDGLAVIKALAVKYPTDLQWQRDLSVSSERIGDVLIDQGDLDGALQSYRDELNYIKPLAQRDPNNGQWQSGLSYTEMRIGDVLKAKNDLAGALASYRDVLAIEKALALKNPSNTEWQRDVSIIDEKIGDTLKAQGDMKGALEPYNESLALRTKLTQANPTNILWQHDLAIASERMGDMLEDQKDYAGAIEKFQIEVSLAEHLLQITPSDISLPRVIFYPTMRIGEIKEQQGDLAGALSAFEKAEPIALHLKQIDPTAPLPAKDIDWVDEALLRVLRSVAARDYPGALATDQEEVAVSRRYLAAIPGDATAKSALANSLGNLSWALLLSNRPQDALDAAQESLTLDPTILFVVGNEADALLLVGRFDEARDLYLANKDKKFANGRTVAQAVRDDFAALRAVGVNTPDMKRIEELLGP